MSGRAEPLRTGRIGRCGRTGEPTRGRDVNIRESSILGPVGAGGIGVQRQASPNTLARAQVTLIFIVILATVVASEWVSAKVRHAII